MKISDMAEETGPLEAAHLPIVMDGGNLRAPLDAAEYVPTFGAVAGVTSVSLVSARYLRLGPVCLVHVLCDVTQGSFAADQRFDITLPMASASADDVSGVMAGTSLPASNDQTQIAGIVRGEGTDEARVTYMGGFVNNTGVFRAALSFSFLVG